jgi:hypothetical protein
MFRQVTGSRSKVGGHDVISDGGMTVLYQGRRYGLGTGGDRFAIFDLSVDERPVIWQFPCDDPGWLAACQAYASLEKLSGAATGAAPPAGPNGPNGPSGPSGLNGRAVEQGPRRRWPRGRAKSS